MAFSRPLAQRMAAGRMVTIPGKIIKRAIRTSWIPTMGTAAR